MKPQRNGKSYYTETEAAHMLGMTVEQLREVVRTHITKEDEIVGGFGRTYFQPSDLLMIRVLASKSTPATTGN